MLCNECRNKKICKYFSMLNNSPLTVEIKSCEAMDPIQPNAIKNNIRSAFKQPIDYSVLNMKQEEEQIDEDEERILVDLSETEESKVLSFTDILLGDDNDGSKKK